MRSEKAGDAESLTVKATGQALGTIMRLRAALPDRASRLSGEAIARAILQA